jgi:methanogenic corrinoid protein MtbC1
MNELSIPLSVVAERLGVHYMTAYRYVRLGVLAATQEQGRWMVRADDLRAFLERRRETPPMPGRRRAGTPRSPGRLPVLLEGRLTAGDESGAWQLVEDSIARGAAVSDVFVGGLGAALRSIGDRWAAGTLSIAQEHEASRVASRLIARLGAQRPRRGRRLGTAVLAAPAGERHELPTAIVADLLRLEGLHVVDLGADTPADEVVGAVAAHDRVLGVGICITTPLSDDERRRSVRADVLRVRRLVDCPVLVGGAALPDRPAAEALGANDWSADAFGVVDWFLVRAERRTPRDQGADT